MTSGNKTEMEVWEVEMRTDFDRYTELVNHCRTRADRGVWEDALGTHLKWSESEHAGHWGYLVNVARDWREHPDTMNRIFDDVDRHRAAGRSTTDEVNWRSLEQARDWHIATERQARRAQAAVMQA